MTRSKLNLIPSIPLPASAAFTRPPTDPNRYSVNEANAKIDAMLVSGGALIRVNDAGRADGIIVAVQNRSYNPSTAVPTVVLRNDDFGRVERLLADGLEVKPDFEITNLAYPDGKTSYNAIGEIPGSDKASELS